jgi:hypothetical protein
MRKLLIGALLVITSFGVQAQDKIIEIPLSNIPSNEEIQMVDEVMGVKVQLQITPSQDTIVPKFAPHRPPMVRPFPPNVQHHNIGMRVPKPEQIIRKGDKVILIFDKNQYEKFRRWDLQRNKRRLEIRIESQKRVGQHSIKRDYLERNPNGR